MSVLRSRLEGLLLWRVWERMLEIEFVDRSVALAGKAFVAFFPLVIVVAAFMPESVRSSILTTVTARLGMRGEALVTAREAFASADDVRKATGLVGLVLTAFFASSFTTALQRVYLRAWRRPSHPGAGSYWRGPSGSWRSWPARRSSAACAAHSEEPRREPPQPGRDRQRHDGEEADPEPTVLLGDARARVLVPTGVITAVAMATFAASATVWMPGVVTRKEDQFGFFGVALALVTWFSGAAICVLIGACAGPVLAEDTGPVGALVRHGEAATLTAGARPPLPPPARELSLRDAFQTTDEP
jgi:membrane protein